MISSGRGRGRIRAPRRGLVGHAEASDFNAMWEILRSALQEIHEKNASELSFEQLYRSAYKIVLIKEGERLYDHVKNWEREWFSAHIMPDIQKLMTTSLVDIALGNVSVANTNERRIAGEEFLQGLKKKWEDHITVMNMTTDILMYMDRVYCANNRKPSIFIAAMGIFRDNILRQHHSSPGAQLITLDVLVSVVLDQIGMEREGDIINKHLIRSCMYMLEGLYENDEENEKEKLYLTTFESSFLNASREFYSKECLNLLRESDARTWLRQTKKRLEEEEARCQTTISLLTSANIAKVVENEMIERHLSEFLALEGTGVKAMIENDRYDDLSLLYNFVCRVDPSKEPLKTVLQAQVVHMGAEINETILATDFGNVPAPADGDEMADGGEKSKVTKMSATAKQTAAAIKWVDEVLKLKEKFDKMSKKCFGDDLVLQTAVTRSFSDFINRFARSSEYVSLFVDDNLKRGIKGKTEAEVDEVLEKATVLLLYIQDKDMFERYYKKHLARRLLHGRSESTDVEKQMISRMKQNIGNSFTQKLEGMFKDMAMSEELTTGYRTHIKNLGDEDQRRIDLSVNVLTTNFWPMEAMGGGNLDNENQSVRWPHEITQLEDSFKAFYLKERNGRMLTWLGFLGNADIRCTFPEVPGKGGALSKERRYEINVSTFSMLVLMLFNDVPDQGTLSFEEIQERTNIPVQDLSRLLYTLSVLPKAKVLNKEPNNRELPKPGDSFSFNTSFHSRSYKIKAPVISGNVNKVEGEEERKETEQRNDEHRGNIIDTVIVRIMKARKEFTHQLLFAEVASQLSQRFKPDVNMMKKRVESLIEREYLERVEDSSVPTYRYLA